MKRLFLPSGRGIQYTTLTSTECDKIAGAAAKGFSKDDSMIELTRVMERMGAQSMVRKMTKTRGPFDDKSPAVWVATGAEELNDSWDEIFTGKDDAVLRALYNKHHSVLPGEIDDIMGKEQEVTED